MKINISDFYSHVTQQSWRNRFVVFLWPYLLFPFAQDVVRTGPSSWKVNTRWPRIVAAIVFLGEKVRGQRVSIGFPSEGVLL